MQVRDNTVLTGVVIKESDVPVLMSGDCNWKRWMTYNAVHLTSHWILCNQRNNQQHLSPTHAHHPQTVCHSQQHSYNFHLALLIILAVILLQHLLKQCSSCLPLCTISGLNARFIVNRLCDSL